MIRSLIALLLFALAPSLSLAQMSCEALKGLNLDKVTINSAALVPEGPEPKLPGSPDPPRIVPAHCRVQAVARPTSDSEIGFEIWLPVANWNGKYQQWGNGGWAGVIRPLTWRTLSSAVT